MMNRLGSISLPQDLPPDARKALADCLLNAEPPLSSPPPRVVRAWLRKPSRTVRVTSLDKPQFESLCEAIHDAWTQHVDPDHSAPAPATRKHILPAGIRTFQPRRATVQRRFILELPHDVTDAARERILTRWLETNLNKHHAFYHAVIHRPPKGNHKRNWHAHIAICHHDVPRKPGSKYPDPDAIRWPLGVNEFSAILSRNAPGLNLQERNELARQTFRDLWNSFAATANEEPRTTASIRRYDPRSYREQGDAITPGQHRGTNATALQKRGIPTTWNDHARDWLNAAHPASRNLTDEEADNILDAIENEMVSTSLGTQNHPFRDVLDEDKRRLDGYLSTAKKVIDAITETAFSGSSDHVPGAVDSKLDLDLRVAGRRRTADGTLRFRTPPVAPRHHANRRTEKPSAQPKRSDNRRCCRDVRANQRSLDSGDRNLRRKPCRRADTRATEPAAAPAAPPHRTVHHGSCIRRRLRRHFADLRHRNGRKNQCLRTGNTSHPQCPRRGKKTRRRTTRNATP